MSRRNKRALAILVTFIVAVFYFLVVFGPRIENMRNPNLPMGGVVSIVMLLAVWTFALFPPA